MTTKKGKKATSAFEDIFGPGEKAVNLEIRAMLMMKIEQFIKANNFSQDEAAEVLGISRVRVSYLLNHHIDKFSIDKLVNMIPHTGQAVTMRVTKAA
jgi:predicted XRE-type DNA-binding protein